MKKISILAVLLFTMVSGSAFASAFTSGSLTGSTASTSGKSFFGGLSATVAAGTTSVLIGKLSNGVNASVAYTVAGYAMAAKHISGTFAFGTSFDSTAIYKTELTVTTACPTLTAPDTTGFATWTAM